MYKEKYRATHIFQTQKHISFSRMNNYIYTLVFDNRGQGIRACAQLVACGSQRLEFFRSLNMGLPSSQFNHYS
jgi:hypothetical protein